MNKIIILFLVTFPLSVFSQQHIHKKKHLFQPYISLNYNITNISYLEYFSGVQEYNSKFFGSEFGFSVLPKKETGLYFSYNNKLIAELGVREIYNLFNSNIGNNITDYTLTSGFFGSLDIGKQIKYNDNSQFIIGIRIADKYVSGVSQYIGYPEMTEYDGFHLAPGIYGEYNSKLSKKYSMSVKLALTNSLLNFWKFAENGDDFDFKHPLFSDLTVKLQHKSGLYLKAENNIMFSYKETEPAFRFTVGIGYQFNYKNK